MKIAIIVSLFPPKWLAGTEIATFNIAKHLTKRGHEVHIITSLDEGFPKQSIEQGFYVHRIRVSKVPFMGIISFWTKTTFAITKIRPDIIHSQTLTNGMPGLMAKIILKKPFIAWGRGLDVYQTGLFTRPLLRLVMHNADAIIALSEDMKKEMQRTYNRNIFMIPNGVDSERFRDISRDMMRHKLQKDVGEKLIIFIGRFRPEKGVQYLIDAMYIIRKKTQLTRLILVGEGPEEANLRELAQKLNLQSCIDFIGKIPIENVPCYLAASDVFVLPSLSEGMPNVVLEAMAAGLPIVATKVGGLPEIIKNGENGFLVEPKNAEQISEKVSLILMDSRLRETLSRNNRENSKNFNWDNIAQKLEGIYKKYI